MIKLNDPDLLKQKAFLDGTWCNADSGKRMEVINPATGELIGTVPEMGNAEAQRAIEAAESGRHASDGFADLVGEHAE